MNYSNDQLKSAARAYYEKVSANEIKSLRMKTENGERSVSIRVFNPTFNSFGSVKIGFSFREDLILLCSKIGIHGAEPLSKYL